jgi:hypothetical protein
MPSVVLIQLIFRKTYWSASEIFKCIATSELIVSLNYIPITDGETEAEKG